MRKIIQVSALTGMELDRWVWQAGCAESASEISIRKVSSISTGEKYEHYVGCVSSLPEGKKLVALVIPNDDILAQMKLRLHYSGSFTTMWMPSRDWGLGGTIIQGRLINLQPVYNQRGEFVEWCAKSLKWELEHSDKNPLVAAMRGVVADKFGEEFEDAGVVYETI